MKTGWGENRRQRLWVVALWWVPAAMIAIPATGESAVWTQAVGQGQELEQSQPDRLAKRGRQRKKRKRRRHRRPPKSPARASAAVKPSPASDVGSGREPESSGPATTDNKSADSIWGTPSWLADSTDSGGGDPLLDETTQVTTSARHRHRQRGVSRALILAQPTLGLGNRNFQYRGAATDNLYAYEGSLLTWVGGRAEIYPAGMITSGGWADIGVRLAYRQTMGLQSSMAGGPDRRLRTLGRQVQTSICGRLRLGDALLTFSAGVGAFDFAVEIPAEDLMNGTVQDVAYRFARGGLDVRYAITEDWTILGGGSYRHLLSSGALGTHFFPHATGFGFHADLGASFRLLSFLEASILVTYDHFGHQLEPAPEATYVAESAVDQYFGMTTGLTLFF